MKKITILFAFFVCLKSIAQLEEKQRIDSILNTWHNAAATSDSFIFFDETMRSNSIYIGTDDTELWTSEELKIWSKRFFEREKAWVFTPKSRNIYFSTSKKVAWFDELLDTWMGICRGSGVLEKIEDKWILKHYHLAITVPNELVNQYLILLKQHNSNIDKKE